MNKSAIDNFLQKIDINEYLINKKRRKNLFFAIKKEAEKKNNSIKGFGMLYSIFDYLLEKLQQPWRTLFLCACSLTSVQTFVLICFVQLIGPQYNFQSIFNYFSSFLICFDDFTLL
ncbi:hypothetical protein ACQ4LE_001686 [Meloidogyne hapla]